MLNRKLLLEWGYWLPLVHLAGGTVFYFMAFAPSASGWSQLFFAGMVAFCAWGFVEGIFVLLKEKFK